MQFIAELIKIMFYLTFGILIAILWFLAKIIGGA